ncbi:hypothetical protein BESB_009390 [Besnoitia besnoiti]|uniref:Uncharacterized protein n=1 Tax=Besnoitia besnoiti TaxID=94643 RepID=A0A2A9MQN2_BESBE|nr:hypothetical protein BESB_009390 [Besnoitia besnoiti]PFH38597.1 hypothetical protein BESB_009390 [Besnoitia besnoiti]
MFLRIVVGWHVYAIIGTTAEEVWHEHSFLTGGSRQQLIGVEDLGVLCCADSRQLHRRTSASQFLLSDSERTSVRDGSLSGRFEVGTCTAEDRKNESNGFPISHRTDVVETGAHTLRRGPRVAARDKAEKPFDRVPAFLTAERWAHMTRVYGFAPLKPYCELCRHSTNFCTKQWDCREFCGNDCAGLGDQLTDALKCKWCGAEAGRCVVWEGCRQGCPEQCRPVLDSRQRLFETGIDELAEQGRKQKLKRRLKLFHEGMLHGTEAESLIKKQLQSSRPEDKQLQELDRTERWERDQMNLREAKETCRIQGITSLLAQSEERELAAAEQQASIEQLDLEDDDSEGDSLWN